MVTHLSPSLPHSLKLSLSPSPALFLTSVAIYDSLGPVVGAPGTDPNVLSLENLREGLSESSRARALLPTDHTEFSFLGSAEKMGEDTNFSGRKAGVRPLRYEGLGPSGSGHVIGKPEKEQEDLRLANFPLPASSVSHHPPRRERGSPSQAVFLLQRSTP